METCRGVEVLLHSLLTSVLNAGERLKSLLNRFAREKELHYPFNGRLVELQNRSRGFGEEKFLALKGTRNPDRPARRLVAIGYLTD
jgi:hypothetical protein